MEISIIPYSPAFRNQWDEAVRQARQASFLFERDFMDYHSDRFTDTSLMFTDSRGHIQALFPACIHPSDATRIESHAGLTYGGLLLLPTATTAVVGQFFDRMKVYYQARGFKQIGYKPVPHIYHTYPAEEDLYWLVRNGAALQSRAVSSVIDLRNPLPFSQLRSRKVRKAERLGFLQISDTMHHLPVFWHLLDSVLVQRHGTHPVHSLSELELLARRFPQCIKLLTVQAPSGTVGSHTPSVCLAGCLLFVMPRVVHVQYIAASNEGCAVGVLDWLFARLAAILQPEAQQRPYLDFGISTEQHGRLLNEGLIFQKEGFGARAVCYDAYTFNL